MNTFNDVSFPTEVHSNTIIQALHSCYPEDRDVDSLDDFNFRQQTVHGGGLGLQNSGDLIVISVSASLRS